MSNDRSKSVSSGQTISFDKINVKIIKKIGEGGYSYVYLAQEINEKRSYAVKNIPIVDERRKPMLKAELYALNTLQGKNFIVQYFGYKVIRESYFILLEYCPVSLFEYIGKRPNQPFSDAELLKIFAQTTIAVQFMHEQNPPLINRDLKVENLLISQNGFIRLCDFGSVTLDKIVPSNMNHAEKCTAEETLKEYTTPHYRSPEILDFYLNFTIDEKSDIWALGCIYYFICYFTYPFDDGARLAILNLRIKKPRPVSVLVDNKIAPLINKIFVLDPSKRPSAKELCEEIASVASKANVLLDEPIFYLNHAQNENKLLQNTQIIFDNMLSKAGNLLGTIKETGSRIKAQINTSVVKKSTIPFTLFTSKIGITGCPNMLKTDKSQGYDGDSTAETLSKYLNKNYPSSYAIVNLINSADYPVSLFENRVLTYDMTLDHVPNLEDIFQMLYKAAIFMSKQEKRILIFHCKDGGYLSYYFACLLIVYTNGMSRFDHFFESVLSSRPDIMISSCHSSFLRYASYVETLCKNPGYIVSSSQVHLTNITIDPVFLCNRKKTCSRPFVNVAIDGNLISSSITNPEFVREYYATDPIIDIPLNMHVCGNVQIMVYHISRISSRLVQKRIFSFQFHTGFDSSSKLTLTGQQLDVSAGVLFDVLANTKIELSLVPGLENTLSKLDTSKFKVYSSYPLLCFSNPMEASSFSATYTSDNLMASDALARRTLFTPISQLCGNEQAVNFTEEPLSDNTNTTENSPPLTSKMDAFNMPPQPETRGAEIQTSDIMAGLEDIFNPPSSSLPSQEPTRQPTAEESKYSFDMFSDFAEQNQTTAPQSASGDQFKPIIEEDLIVPTNVSNSQKDDFSSLSGIDFTLSTTSIHKAYSSETNLSSNVSNPSDTFLQQNTRTPGFFVGYQSNMNSASQLFTQSMGQPTPNRPKNQASVGVSSGPSFMLPQQNSFPNFVKAEPKIDSAPVIPQNTSNSSMNKSSVFGSQNRRGGAPEPSFGPTFKPTSSDPFGDILSSHGFSNKPQTATTNIPSAKPSMNEAKRMQDESLTNDPVNRIVKEWSKGKKMNIRALLSTLHLILWQTDKWSPVGMHQLTDFEQIKKFFRKACICVHPDKHTGTPNEQLARAIFCELNESYTAFESSGGKVYN